MGLAIAYILSTLTGPRALPRSGMAANLRAEAEWAPATSSIGRPAVHACRALAYPPVRRRLNRRTPSLANDHTICESREWQRVSKYLTHGHCQVFQLLTRWPIAVHVNKTAEPFD